jgi:hypothetical protein
MNETLGPVLRSSVIDIPFVGDLLTPMHCSEAGYQYFVRVLTTTPDTNRGAVVVTYQLLVAI